MSSVKKVKIPNFFLRLILTNSNESSMRFIAIHSVIIVTYTWLFVSIWNRQIQDIPDGVIYFIGITVGGKVWEKHFETKNNKVNKNEQEEKM